MKMRRGADHIDSAIDDAARSMTAGAVDGAFRASVLGRLEEPRSRWNASWGLPAAVGAIAAAAAIVVLQNDSGRPALPARALPLSTTAMKVAAGTAASLVEAIERPQPASDGSGRRTPSAPPLGAAVAELAPPPLQVPSIAVPALGGAESILIQRLEPIAPISVEPIGEQGEQR